MFGLGAGEILVIGVVALIFIGPKKLPELAKGLGKGIREFQRAKDDLMTEVDKESITEEVKSAVSEAKTAPVMPGPEVEVVETVAKSEKNIEHPVG